jgi:DNA polymerase-3 subunit epsilon
VRYGIDNSKRTKHGALLDAELLAEVYLELIGAKQASLVLVESNAPMGRSRNVKLRPTPLPSRVDDATRDAHRAFVATLGDDAIWKKYT